jgi:hypothetical protein
MRPLSRPIVSRDFGLGDFFSRPVYLSTMNLPAEGAGTEVYPLTQYLSNAVVAEKIKYFRILNAIIHVRVELALTPHHYGWAHVCLAADTISAVGAMTANRWWSIPGATLDFSVSNPVELSRRLSTPGTGVDLTETSGLLGKDRACSLAVTTCQGLARDDGVAVGTQLLKIYAWLTDVELGAPSIYSVASGPAPSKDSPSGPPADALPSGSMISDAPTRVFAATVVNGASTDEPTTAQPLSLTSTKSVPRSLVLDPMDTTKKDYWYNLWGYVGSFTWATTDAPGAQLGVVPVTPALSIKTVVGTDTYYTTTPLGAVTIPFARWSGTLRIRFRTSATAFHRGRLMVAYAPNVVSDSAVALGTVTATGENEILDVASGFDKTFCVNWSQAYPNATIGVYQIGLSLCHHV